MHATAPFRLHTKGFGTIQALSQPEISTQIWTEITRASFLKEEGGTLLLLVPGATEDAATFDSIVDAIRLAVTERINPMARVTGCHPHSSTDSARSPVPTVQVFLDNADLFIEGASMGDMKDFF